MNTGKAPVLQAPSWGRPRSGVCKTDALRSIGNRSRVALAHAALAVGMVATAWAADDSRIIFPNGAAKSAAPVAGGGSTANSITLVLAVLIAAVGAWLFWRNRQARGISGGAHLLSIDETRSLGNRQYLVVASYENKKFLLGVCQGRIDLLSPLHEDQKDLRG